NRGTGPLELYPVHEPCGTGGTKVFQRLYVDANTNGFERGTDTAFHDQYAGCMEYHAQHRHWHFENFAKYSLHPITTTSGAEQLGTAIKESPKVSFCMVDTLRKDPSLTGSPAQKYYTECGRTSTLGISIGWSDVYGETLSGRYFEISGVPDGAYCIASTADPAVSTSVDGLLVESNNSNNSASTRVQLAGTTVTTTSTHPYSSTCGL
ncbi:MAG TPA: lysyl oxidase family protein, partial [Chloroflexota bacterium]|nr:lysyl oxidase family protein [Chloroflexota bacterium]